MLRAFTDHGPGGANPGARGNPCRVELCAADPGPAMPGGDVTTCRSWLGRPDVAALRCWGADGSPITLCGHGLLCCGVAWQLHGRGVGALAMGGMRVEFSRGERIAWIGLPRIETVDCDPPAWTATLFPAPPLRCAHAGGSDGYLVLEWPPGTDLRSLRAPDRELADHTRRAIIATSAITGRSALQVQLRYFAPQYGSTEDSATGSAMRVLADYWHERLGDTLCAWQRSSRGGLLHSRLAGSLCWVGGRVALEASA